MADHIHLRLADQWAFPHDHFGGDVEHGHPGQPYLDWVWLPPADLDQHVCDEAERRLEESEPPAGWEP